MAVWRTNVIPQTPDIKGQYIYPNGMIIKNWHELHVAFTGDNVLSRWGAVPALCLGTERPGYLGVKWKKQVKQTKYISNTSTIIEVKVFWVPVLVEGDPLVYQASKIISVMGPNKGSNMSSSPGSVNVFHLPLMASLFTVQDVLRLGSASSNATLTSSSPLLQQNITELNPGRFVSTSGGFDYYWQDTQDYPHFVQGAVSSTGPTVSSGTNLQNPYTNTLFVGNLSAYSKSGRKVSRLYEYEKLTVRGKDIYPGSAYGGVGADGGQGYKYSKYAISVGKLSPDPDSFSGMVPVVVSQNDYTQIQSWKTASSTVPTAPSTAPAVHAANGLGGLPSYISTYSTLWQSGTAGFQTYSISAPGLWNDFSPGQSASIDVSDGQYIVYPTYYVSSNKKLRTEAEHIFNFTSGTGGVSFPKAGQHFGIFDNVTDANAWKNYYNQILLAKQAGNVKDLVGYVFAAGPDWVDRYQVSINVDGLGGIVSQNALLANIGRPASSNVVVGSDVDADIDSDSPGTAEGGNGGGAFRVTMQYAVNTVTKQNVNLLIKQLMANEKLSFTQTKEKFIAEFIKARTKYQVSLGKTQTEARAIALSRSNVIFNSATANSNAGGEGSTNSAPPPSTIRIPVVRGLIGYQPPPSALGDSPQLVQKYQYTQVSIDDNGTETMDLVPTERRFVFPFAPKDVTYSNLSSVWTEINRTGRYPIVDWTNFQLLKVSFTFELVDRNSTDPAQPRDGFGLFYSIDEKINVLRQMATAPYPVSFLNMDTFFSKELRYPLYTQGRGVEFVITDFAVQSVQRTPAIGSAGLTSIQPNQISRASCTITLQECPIEQVDIISIPKITVCPKTQCPPPTCKPPCTEKPREWAPISKVVNNTVAATPTDG
jgi:hypothetical protein